MKRHSKKRFRRSVVAIVAAGYFAGLIFWGIARASTVTYVELETIVAAPMSEPARETFRAQISAYTSSTDETDDRPHENAAGTKPKPGSIACPSRYPFGTEVLIHKKKYICDDRMARRYSGGDFFDVWMQTKDEAIHFGRQTITVVVLK